MSTPSDFIPDSTVTTHSGETIKGTAWFFMPPPAEIGVLFTAHSSVGMTVQRWTVVRIVATLVICAVFGVLGVYVWIHPRILMRFGMYGTDQFLGEIGILAVVAVLIALTWAEFLKPTCTYVGLDGCARWSAWPWSLKKPKLEVLEFKDAVDLSDRVDSTHYLWYGIFHYKYDTCLRYKWTGADGRVLFQIVRRGNFSPSSLRKSATFHFACAAKIAWYGHLERMGRMKSPSPSGTAKVQVSLLQRLFRLAGRTAGRLRK